MNNALEPATPERLALRVSAALAVWAALTSAVSFFFWGPFHRDVAMGIGNLRGTALTMLVLGIPTLVLGMRLAARGSERGRALWLGATGYIAYNALLFCFQSHFNRYFLLFTTLLSLTFFALVTTFRAFDANRFARAAARVPRRAVAGYLFVSMLLFAALWLMGIVPAVIADATPAAVVEAGTTQNAVWVVDFAFTYPLMAVAGVLLWRGRPWGYALAGILLVMLTVETAGVAVDQTFGHLHDPHASLAAVPPMVVLTLIGAAFTALFLGRMDSARAVGVGRIEPT